MRAARENSKSIWPVQSRALVQVQYSTRSRDIYGGYFAVIQDAVCFRRAREGLKRDRYATDDEFRDQPNLGNHSRYIWGEHRHPRPPLLRLKFAFFFFFTISGHVPLTAIVERARRAFRKRTAALAARARAHIVIFQLAPPDGPTNYTNASVRRDVLVGGEERWGKEEGLGTFVHGKIRLQSLLLRAC